MRGNRCVLLTVRTVLQCVLVYSLLFRAAQRVSGLGYTHSASHSLYGPQSER